MSPLSMRRLARRVRRHAVGLLLVLAIGGAIAAHHTGVGVGAQHDDHGDGLSAAIEMCVGVFTAVGASVVAVAIGLLALGRWPTLIVLGSAGACSFSGTCTPEARAGPPPLSLLCTWRR